MKKLSEKWPDCKNRKEVGITLGRKLYYCKIRDITIGEGAQICFSCPEAIFYARALPPQELLIEPVSGLRNIFRKFAYFTSTSGTPITVTWDYIPVYLPELRTLVLLETTSRRVGADFFEFVSSFEKGKFLLGTAHHLDFDFRRTVTWGNYSLVKIEEEKIVEKYSVATFLGLLLSPSFMMRGKVVNTRRYVPLEASYKGCSLKCDYFYNIFLVFLDPKRYPVRRPRKIWLCRSLNIVPTKGLFIELNKTGKVIARKIYLWFNQNDVETYFERGYYICIAESFNSYMTSHEKGRFFCGKNINIVTGLYPLVHSPYDVLPFLAPFTKFRRKDFLVEFTVPTHVVRTILKRFEKFEGLKGSADLSYELLFRGLVKIQEEGNFLVFKAVNPSLIGFLTKKIAKGSSHASALLKEFDLLRLAEEKNNYLQKVVEGWNRILALEKEFNSPI